MRKLAMILSLLVPAQLWADEYDYYVLSLSWSASFCDIEGDAKQSDQCEVQHDYKWILHGLWPQYHQGWPAYCNTSERPPSRWMTRDMIDIMGSRGLAWQQWKKHGSCSGRSAEEYFTKSREASVMYCKFKAFSCNPCVQMRVSADFSSIGTLYL